MALPCKRAPSPRGEQDRRRLLIAGLAVAIILPPAATLVVTPAPLLVWNVSSSAPTGLYRVHPGTLPALGDTVVALPPPGAGALAAARGYLPSGVPLVKRVASAAGAHVCARGRAVLINGRLAALRKEHDARGRALPRWSGCVTFRSDDYFLLGRGSWSFDGRYFGVTHGREIIGRAELLWRR
jgi:conjugative transfer signal peptidase TraF